MKFSIILWIHYFSSWSYAFHFLSLTIQTGLVLIINSIVHLTKPEGKTEYYYNEHFNENKFLLSTDLMPHGKIYFDSSYQDIHFTYLIKTYCIFGCLRYIAKYLTIYIQKLLKTKFIFEFLISFVMLYWYVEIENEILWFGVQNLIINL